MKTTTRIAHYKYYSDEHKENYPSALDILDNATNEMVTAWPTATMFNKYRITDYTTIKRIIIQTIPGLKVYIYKNSADTTPLPYIIGATGILDLNLTNINNLLISGLTIDTASKEVLYNLKNGYFIITVIYELTEEEA